MKKLMALVLSLCFMLSMGNVALADSDTSVISDDSVYGVVGCEMTMGSNAYGYSQFRTDVAAPSAYALNNTRADLWVFVYVEENGQIVDSWESWINGNSVNSAGVRSEARYTGFVGGACARAYFSHFNTTIYTDALPR